MFDFHSHILPGIDDGSESIEQSLQMLEKSKQAGVEGIIASPHFYADRDLPERFLQRRSRSLRELEKACIGKGLPPVIPGAEVAYFEGMSDCEELYDLRIVGTDMILVEMPAISWNSRMIDEIAAIYEKTGLVPIIAHIDRYIKVFGKKDMADWFDGLPVLIQVNANFFEIRKFARLAAKMFVKGRIHLFGSDCHNLTSRPPNMELAFSTMEKLLGPDAVRKVELTEKAILEGSKREALRVAYGN